MSSSVSTSTNTSQHRGFDDPRFGAGPAQRDSTGELVYRASPHFLTAYRVSFRLTGDRRVAAEIAVRTLVQIETSARLSDPELADIAQSALTASLTYCSAHPEIGASDTHQQQRARLRRELGRITDFEQSVLCLRHLVQLTPSRIAVVLGVRENLIREICQQWVAEDAPAPESTMLEGLAEWTDNDFSRSRSEIESPHYFGHLDDPQPPVSHKRGPVSGA